ncbi:uncharacterized protein BJ171DRAFT_513507 [Polychytrium aggregatum]|uniref:uncharacterized protein n=1 Tax=Polychytrium aggregatum TaxID=110093 RepID=UPI0022FE176E|nr:uncharacterized protein BJ171DRAFT_513507 [Polychytrium aggregatum]KAI9202598.1 hypothetical protein BJ171DRAFT_513507 [Polychytrium aggregatum]
MAVADTVHKDGYLPSAMQRIESQTAIGGNARRGSLVQMAIGLADSRAISQRSSGSIAYKKQAALPSTLPPSDTALGISTAKSTTANMSLPAIISNINLDQARQPLNEYLRTRGLDGKCIQDRDVFYPEKINVTDIDRLLEAFQQYIARRSLTAVLFIVDAGLQPSAQAWMSLLMTAVPRSIAPNVYICAIENLVDPRDHALILGEVNTIFLADQPQKYSAKAAHFLAPAASSNPYFWMQLENVRPSAGMTTAQSMSSQSSPRIEFRTLADERAAIRLYYRLNLSLDSDIIDAEMNDILGGQVQTTLFKILNDISDRSVLTSSHHTCKYINEIINQRQDFPELSKGEDPALIQNLKSILAVEKAIQDAFNLAEQCRSESARSGQTIDECLTHLICLNDSLIETLSSRQQRVDNDVIRSVSTQAIVGGPEGQSNSALYDFTRQPVDSLRLHMDGSSIQQVTASYATDEQDAEMSDMSPDPVPPQKQSSSRSSSLTQGDTLLNTQPLTRIKDGKTRISSKSRESLKSVNAKSRQSGAAARSTPESAQMHWTDDDQLQSQGYYDSPVQPTASAQSADIDSATAAATDVEETVNLLVLGETGVGKSTLINSLANYLSYQTLEDAQAGEAKTLIPAKFVICHPDTFEEVEVKTETLSNVNPDNIALMEEINANEQYVTGQSTTQRPQAYSFNVPGDGDRFIKVNIIDTPGMGDSRGIEQDKKNMSNIIKYVTNMGSLNAVVIALPTNQSKLTVWFRFCIMELFKYLDKDVIQNISFLFTKARTTSFRMGDTTHVLKKLFTEIKSQSGIQVPLTEANTFLIDNEAYRFLIAKDHDIGFTPSEIEQFKDSWLRSSLACHSLVALASKGNPKSFEKTGQLEVLRTFLETHMEELMDMDTEIQQGAAKTKQTEQIIQTVQSQLVDLKSMVEVVIVLTPRIHHGEVVICRHPECADYSIDKLGVNKVEGTGSFSQGWGKWGGGATKSVCKPGYRHEPRQYYQKTGFTYETSFEERYRDETKLQIEECEQSLDENTRKLASLRSQDYILKYKQKEYLRLVAVCNQQLRKHSVVHRNETFLDESDFQVIQQQAYSDGVLNPEKLRKLEARIRMGPTEDAEPTMHWRKCTTALSRK